MIGYGIKYKCEFTSNKGLDYKVYILQKGYDSAVYDLRMGGNPVSINYTSGSENKFEIIRGSECVLNFFSEYDGQFTEIMYADKNDFLIQVWLNDELHWQGYIIQDNYSEPFAAAPYLMSLRATDGLGDLKLIEFEREDGTVFLGNMTFVESILNCLAHLKNGNQLVTSNDVFEATIDRNLVTNEALNMLTVNPFMYLENELNPKRCSDVLKMILELFQCYIYYKKGKYWIERINYKLNETLTRHTYNINFDGDQSIVNTVSSENIRAKIEREKDKPLIFINNDHNSTYVAPYNKVITTSTSDEPSNLVVNNYFRYWNADNSAPLNWNKLGTLSINTAPYIGEGDALRILTKTPDNQVSFSTNMLFAAKTSYSGRLSSTSADELTVTVAFKGNARIMVRFNTSRPVTYYLSATGYTENNEVTYSAEFKDVPTFCNLKNFNTGVSSELNKDWAVAKLTTKIPNVTTSIDVCILPSFDSENYTGECHIREVTPTIKAGDSVRSKGLNYSIISNKNVRETYTFDPSLGEFGYAGLINQIFVNNVAGRVVTASWYRDDKPENKSLFGIGVQSILNQYRTASRLFSGSFYGGFDYGKVYEIETLEGLYMPFKCNSDLKFDTHNVEFFELLDDSDVSSDKFKIIQDYKDGGYTSSNKLTNAPSAGGGGTPRPKRGGGM